MYHTEQHTFKNGSLVHNVTGHRYKAFPGKSTGTRTKLLYVYMCTCTCTCIYIYMYIHMYSIPKVQPMCIYMNDACEELD